MFRVFLQFRSLRRFGFILVSWFRLFRHDFYIFHWFVVFVVSRVSSGHWFHGYTILSFKVLCVLWFDSIKQNHEESGTHETHQYQYILRTLSTTGYSQKFEPLSEERS